MVRILCNSRGLWANCANFCWICCKIDRKSELRNFVTVNPYCILTKRLGFLAVRYPSLSRGKWTIGLWHNFDIFTHGKPRVVFCFLVFFIFIYFFILFYFFRNHNIKCPSVRWTYSSTSEKQYTKAYCV